MCCRERVGTSVGPYGIMKIIGVLTSRGISDQRGSSGFDTVSARIPTLGNLLRRIEALGSLLTEDRTLCGSWTDETNKMHYVLRIKTRA